MRATVAGMRDLRMTVAVSVSKINSVSAIKVAGRFTDVVLADADRWILRAGAAGHVVLCPRETIIRRQCNATTAAVCSARRVRDIDSAICRNLNVPVDPTCTLRRVEEQNGRTKRLPTVVAT